MNEKIKTVTLLNRMAVFFPNGIPFPPLFLTVATAILWNGIRNFTVKMESLENLVLVLNRRRCLNTPVESLILPP